VLVGGLAILLLAVVGLGAGAYLLFGDDPTSTADVPKIAAQLNATDMKATADRQTGLRPLVSILAEPTEYDAIAVGRDGTMALAVRQLGEVRIVRFTGGTQSASFLEGAQAVTALAVDPDGTVYVGLRQGGYAHITPEGVVHQDATLAEGFSIVGFAFDPASRRSAVMLSGGEVRTGLRPLSREGLHTVTMPERARIRAMTYDGEGDLWVAGDAGAVFVSTEDGWEERNLMTPGRVTAFGTGPDGDVVAGQSGGQIYRQSGGGWTLLGQIGATPIATGSDAEGSVVVAAADGTLHREAQSTTDFAEVNDYAAPAGDHAVHGAVVLGPIAAFVTPERAWVWDEVLWDSGAEQVQHPAGAEGRVVPLGPWSARFVSDPPTYFVLEDDDTTLRRYEGDALTSMEEVAYQDGTVSAGSFRSAVRAAIPDRRVWLNQAHHAMDDYGISRWDGSEGYTELARFPEDAGRLVSASGRTTDDGVEIVAITDSGSIYRALLSAEEPAFEEVVPHARFQELYGEDFFPASASVASLGPGNVVVIHDGEKVTKVDVESDTVEVLDLGVEGRVHGVVTLSSGALIAKGDALLEVGEGFSATPWTLPEGVVARFSSRRGHLLFAVRGDQVLIGGDNRGRTFAFRCRARECERLPLPANTTPAALFFASDSEALVWREDGVLAVLPLPRGAGE
jgi:hypothetical protein